MNIENGSGAMFDGIAKKYDLLNKLTSLGFDTRWRKKTVSALQLKPNDMLLDLAAGTCDIAIEAVNQYPSIQVIAADPSKQMLLEGQKKIKDKNLLSQIHIAQSTGEHLPFAPRSLGGAIISFGIRNFKNRQLALAKIKDALKKESRLAILELSLPNKGLLSLFTRFYVKKFIPTMGALLSSKKEYIYLPKSMEQFPSPSEFKVELTDAGFNIVNHTSFMFGVCNLFVLSPRS